MHGINEYEKAVLELLNEYSPNHLSERHIWQTIFKNKGHKRPLIEDAIKSLENKKYINRLGNRTRYEINPASEFKLYPIEFENELSNLKAINLIINIYNESFYPNLTFEEFYNDKLEKKVSREPTRKILNLAYNHGFIPDLPLDLRSNKLNIQRIKRLGTWYSKLIANIESHPIIKTISIVILLSTVVMTIAWFMSSDFQEFLRTLLK
jgi:hypothetical protein